jgi:hypothetical protein
LHFRIIPSQSPDQQSTLENGMSRINHLIAALVISTAVSSSAFAAPDTPLSAADRTAIVQTLSAKMNANYIDPPVADKAAKAIAKKNAAGGYASALTKKDFSEALAKDLREFSGDLHFGTMLDDDFKDYTGPYTGPTPEQMERAREQTVRRGFDIEKIERLPGNVGYIELRRFGGTEFVGPAYTAALSLLAGTDALIIDLRRNGGGSPGSVAYLLSHFCPLGDQRHLIDMYNRPDNTTRQIWTVPTVGARYDKPVYVLTSARTFSGGEDCAYSFQAQKRGTIVGETTGGGSNPVGWFSAGHGVVVAIPVSRATNFVTKTNWEHVGVKPDVAVPAAQALQTAHAAILRNLVASTKDEAERTKLQAALAMVEKGEAEKPIYTLRGEK